MAGEEMTVEEFGSLAAAWGADIARWPEETRQRAEALASVSPSAAALLLDAGRLDRAIASARPVVAPARSDALVGRIATTLAAEAAQDPGTPSVSIGTSAPPAAAGGRGSCRRRASPPLP